MGVGTAMVVVAVLFLVVYHPGFRKGFAITAGAALTGIGAIALYSVHPDYFAPERLISDFDDAIFVILFIVGMCAAISVVVTVVRLLIACSEWLVAKIGGPIVINAPPARPGVKEPPTRDYERWQGDLFEKRKRPARLKSLQKTESRSLLRTDCSDAPNTSVRSSEQSNPEVFGRSEHTADQNCSDAPNISRVATGAGRRGSEESSEGVSGPGLGHNGGPPLNGYAIVEQDGRIVVTKDGELVGTGFQSEDTARQWIKQCEQIRAWETQQACK